MLACYWYLGTNSKQAYRMSRVLADAERRVQSGEDSEARASTSSEVSFELIGHLGTSQPSTKRQRLRIRQSGDLAVCLLAIVGT